MRQRGTSAAWAVVIIALSMFVSGSVPFQRTPLQQWLLTIAEAVPMLAMHALALAGRRGGPEGLPPIPEIVLLTFALWWAIVEVVRALWRRLRARPHAGSSTTTR